jgi:predicted enzyme related to lactoylglutathione lyase
MGTRTEYSPGTFCWVELATTDSNRAKSFYTELLGCEAEDRPAGEGVTYTTLRRDGDNLGGLMEQQAAQREAGVPPNWASYVSVEDVDATAARAAELGGTVHAQPFDVMELGRMAVIQDPTGAIFGTWQPKENIGAQRVNEPGCWCWNELQTHDPEAAKAFYGELFGWSFEPIDTGGGPEMSQVKNAADWRIANMTRTGDQQGDVPPHWLVYFAFESCDDAVAKTGERGGGILFGPLDIPVGRFAVLRDPQGAAFGVLSGQLDD